ncbi:MAG: hypothetical protein LHV68_05345 [Elusimicrobia bacterium]|nr:hypothetical protein [Candidatus Liberimonas magnetica]
MKKLTQKKTQINTLKDKFRELERPRGYNSRFFLYNKELLPVTCIAEFVGPRTEEANLFFYTYDENDPNNTYWMPGVDTTIPDDVLEDMKENTLKDTPAEKFPYDVYPGDQMGVLVPKYISKDIDKIENFKIFRLCYLKYQKWNKEIIILQNYKEFNDAFYKNKYDKIIREINSKDTMKRAEGYEKLYDERNYHKMMMSLPVEFYQLLSKQIVFIENMNRLNYEKLYDEALRQNVMQVEKGSHRNFLFPLEYYNFWKELKSPEKNDFYQKEKDIKKQFIDAKKDITKLYKDYVENNCKERIDDELLIIINRYNFAYKQDIARRNITFRKGEDALKKDNKYVSTIHKRKIFYEMPQPEKFIGEHWDALVSELKKINILKECRECHKYFQRNADETLDKFAKGINFCDIDVCYKNHRTKELLAKSKK